jgi:hypothetical protein
MEESRGLGNEPSSPVNTGNLMNVRPMWYETL